MTKLQFLVAVLEILDEIYHASNPESTQHNVIEYIREIRKMQKEYESRDNSFSRGVWNNIDTKTDCSKWLARLARCAN